MKSKRLARWCSELGRSRLSLCTSVETICGEGNGTPLQYSCLENPMDGGPWWAAVHGVAKSRTRLSNFTLTFHFHALEKEMATHSSVLAWRVPGMGEPGGLPSMGSHRVGHDWSDLAAVLSSFCPKEKTSTLLPWFPWLQQGSMPWSLRHAAFLLPESTADVRSLITAFFFLLWAQL